MEKWDRRFLEMAALCGTWSKDPSTKVGAVIVSDRRRVVSVGYNGFPRGINDDDELLHNRDLKLLLVAHAERNALDNAECSVVGSTLYTTLFPCNECTKSIIQRRITRVVSFSIPESKYQKYNFDSSINMLSQCNIDVKLYSN